MSALPGCTISDTYGALVPSGSIAALSGLIRAQASVTPLFVQQSDGSWLEHADVVVSTRSAAGLWTLVLPSQPNCDPAGVTWSITLPDGTTWNGAVSAAMVTASQSAPLTLHQLVHTYGWAATSVVSPSADATTLKIGAVLIDVEPSSGHPVALTAPRLGAASGIATLDGGGHVPLGQLSGLTTNQLSSSAGIVASQITSVSAAALTGSHTLPDGVLSTNVPLLNTANTFTAPQTISGTGLGARALLNNATASTGRLWTVESTDTGTLEIWDRSGGSRKALYSGTYGWQWDSGPVPFADANNDIGTSSLRYRHAWFSGTLTIIEASPSTTPLIVKGAASQSADLTQWQDSTGTARVQVDAAGKLTLTASSGPHLQEWRSNSGTPLGSVVIPDGNLSIRSTYLEAQGTTAGAYIQMSPTGAISLIGIAAGQPVLIAKGAPSQSTDIQQWADNTGGVMARITNAGTGVFNSVSINTNNYIVDSSNNGPFILIAVNAFTHYARSATQTPIIVQGAAGQSADLQKWQDSTGTVLARIGPGGGLFANRGIDAFTGSAGGVGLGVHGAASQTADLQQWQSSTGTVLSRVDSSGAIYADQLNNQTTAGGYNYNLDNTGRLNLVANGINAPMVTVTQNNPGVSTDTVVLYCNGTSTTYGLTVKTGTATQQVLRVQGATSQSADLQQWQDSAGAVLASVGNAGDVAAKNFSGFTSGGTYIDWTTVTPTFISTAVGTIGIIVKGTTSQTADLQQWQNSAGSVLAKVDSAGNIFSSSAVCVGRLTGDQGYLNVTNPTNAVGIFVRGNAAQTLDLQQWANSGGTVLAQVTSDGTIGCPVLRASGGSNAYLTFNTSTVTANSGNPTIVPFTVKGAVSQTADLQNWRDNGGALLARVDNNGSFYTSQGMVVGGLTGGLGYFNVTALNAGIPAVTVTGHAGQTADLQQWYDSGGNLLTKVDAIGIISNTVNTTSGVASVYTKNTNGGGQPGFNAANDVGTTVELGVYGSTFLSGYAGLENQGYVGSSGGLMVVSDFSTTTGTDPITFRVGGYDIPNEKMRLTSTGNLLLGTTTPIAASGVGLAIKAIPSQVTDLTQWQDSTGAVLARIGPGGGLFANMGMDASAGSAGSVAIGVHGASGQTADLTQWLSSTAAVLARVDASGAIAPQNGARITSGSGAPTTPGGLNPSAGDLHIRTDTPGTANQRLYMCSVGGATPTWIGIV